MMPRQALTDRYSPTSRHLADAALLIAKANHYMVGFHADEIKDISLADYQDANSYLIELENKASRRGAHMPGPFNLAFSVLADACRRAHKFELSH